MMKIGMLTQWFDPEPGPASLPGVLARELAARGHDVQIVTGFPNYPDGVLHDGYGIRKSLDEVTEGVKIRRVALYPSHDESRIKRIANYGSFAASSTAWGIDCLRDRDAVWVSNSPITVAAPMMRLHRSRVPILLHVLDLWPDNITSAGVNAPGAAGKLVDGALHRWTRQMYRLADRVLTIAPGVGKVLQSRGVPERKIRYLPLWANEDYFYPADGARVREHLGITNDTVVVMYAGTLGRAQGVDRLIKASEKYSRKGPAAEIWIAGSGSEEVRLRALAQRRPEGAPAIRFLGRVPMADMAPVMAAGDIHVVSLTDDNAGKLTMPSKVQAILACGKPILSTGSGDLSTLVVDEGLGIQSSGSDTTAIGQALVASTSLGRARLTAFGLHGRTVYERRFSVGAAAGAIEAEVAALCDSKGPTL